MSATKDLRRMIRIWKQQGKTVIIAEHRLYYLKELIDRVVYLKDGRIEKDYSALDALKLSVTQQAEMVLDRTWRLCDTLFALWYFNEPVPHIRIHHFGEYSLDPCPAADESAAGGSHRRVCG